MTKGVKRIPSSYRKDDESMGDRAFLRLLTERMKEHGIPTGSWKNEINCDARRYEIEKGEL